MKEKTMSAVEHLNELRKRIIYTSIAILITTAVSYYFKNEILDFITRASKIEKLVFIKPAEAFFVLMKISLLAGIIGAMPFILYQIWKYVGIALTKKERKYLIYFGPVSYILFLCGAAFAYRGVLPLGIRFLLSFSQDNIIPMITLSGYISFLTRMIIAFGLMFELPLVVLFLSILGVVTPGILKKWRKYAILVIFLVAAVLTPPDVISQIMLAVPILLLYEISILICYVVTKKREKELGAEETLANEA